MPYDEIFYQRYQEYLREDTVRKSHDFAFAWFKRFTHSAPLLVVDLGCGLGEYEKFGNPARYAGVDMNDSGAVDNFIHADYHDFGFLKQLNFMPNAFVSLFSIEPFHPAREKYVLYEKIFSQIPSITWGLVSGFFYESKRDKEVVEELKGAEKIVSYQTIEGEAKHVSKIFSERRLYISTPSKMFGKDVIEVWKIFSRR